MKINVSTLTKSLLSAVIIISFGFVPSDDCKTYFPMEKGKQFELSYFTDKGKPEGRTEYEISDKQETLNGLMSTVHMKTYDKKDKMVMETDFGVKCEDGVFSVDIRGILNGAQMEQMQAMEGMDISVTTVDLEIPSSLSVGDRLKDGKLEMKMKAAEGGMALMSFNTYITNRKVEAWESVTTPAGTFDCIVISSDIQAKSGFINMNFQGKEWIAENVGVVRSENYRKGKLEGYTELTKF